MNNDQTLQWGILGCARIAATAMIPGIKGSANGEILAIASRELEKAKAYAGKFDIPRAYGSYDALLDDPEIRAVYVPLPNSLHKEWTIKAAKKGKHVLCEKPIACCAAHAQEMNAACRENGVLLMEAFAQRFHPQYQTERISIEAVHQWQLELEFFADRVLTARPIESPGENGVANMRAIDAVVQSAQTGVPVELS